MHNLNSSVLFIACIVIVPVKMGFHFSSSFLILECLYLVLKSRIHPWFRSYKVREQTIGTERNCAELVLSTWVEQMQVYLKILLSVFEDCWVHTSHNFLHEHQFLILYDVSWSFWKRKLSCEGVLWWNMSI